MKLIRWIVKMVLLPVAISLTLIQWIGIFLNSISRAVLGILSFIFVLTAAASMIFRLATWQECLAMAAFAFVLYALPYAGSWLIERIILLRCMIGDYIRS